MDFEYKKEIVDFVERQKKLRASRSKTLSGLELGSSTYYSWEKLIEQGPPPQKVTKPTLRSLHRLKSLIIETKRTIQLWA